MSLPQNNCKTESQTNKLEGMVQVCYSKKYRENSLMKRGVSSGENITVAEKLLYGLSYSKWQKRDWLSSMTSGGVQHDPDKEYCIGIESDQRLKCWRFGPKKLLLRNGQYLKVDMNMVPFSFSSWPWTEKSHTTTRLPIAPPSTPTYCELKYTFLFCNLIIRYLL